jgi:hypothetical protein
VDANDKNRIFSAVNSSFSKIFYKQKALHIKKFFGLVNQQKPTPKSVPPEANKFVLNISDHVLTQSEEAVLRKGLCVNPIQIWT